MPSVIWSILAFLGAILVVLESGRWAFAHFSWTRRWMLENRHRVPQKARPWLKRILRLPEETLRGREGFSLEQRLGLLASQSRPGVALVGASYLDVVVSPVRTTQLSDTEYSDVSALELAPGGSGVFVSRYLWEAHGRSSTLITQTGSSRDALSTAFRRMIQASEGTRLGQSASRSSAGCAISVHLRNEAEGFSTVFTKKGAASELTWESAMADTQRALHGGGVVYLSGVFRTGLLDHLVPALNGLPPGTLVILDHGRFEGHDAAQSMIRQVLDAFQRGLVDIYVCTPFELFAFASKCSEELGISPLP